MSSVRLAIEAAAELCLVLRELEYDVELVPRPAGVAGPGGLRMDVVEAPTSTSAAVHRTLDVPSDAVGALVTSMLGPAHRDALTAAGAAWLDRRGEICVPPLGIDAEVAPMLAPPPARADVWERRGVIAVALALLQQQGPVPVAWDLGFYAGLTGSGATLALQSLRALDMIDEHDHPRRHALFAQLVARWHTYWFPIPRLPTEAELAADDEARWLIAGRDDLRQPGWALIPQTPTLGGEAMGTGCRVSLRPTSVRLPGCCAGGGQPPAGTRPPSSPRLHHPWPSRNDSGPLMARRCPRCTPSRRRSSRRHPGSDQP